MSKETKLNNVFVVHQSNRARINIPLDYIKNGTLKIGVPYDLILKEKKSEDFIIKRKVKKGTHYEVEFFNGEIIEIPIKEEL